MFKPVERASLVEEVARQIQTLVLDGRLKPGEKLPSQQELCAQFGVSRSCVREALRSLEGYGLLENRVGGTFVRPRAQAAQAVLEAWGLAHEHSLEDFLQVRMALEGTAAALAASRASAAAILKLGRAMAAMREAATREDWDALAQADVVLHRVIYEASGNKLLARVLETLSDLQVDIRRAVMSIPERKERLLGLHEPLCDAIERRDPRAARQFMERLSRVFTEDFGVQLDFPR